MVIPGTKELAAHVHRWRIEEALSATSSGTCRECGTERHFKNERKPGDLSHPDEIIRPLPWRRRPIAAFTK